VVYLYPMKSKSNTFQCFKQFCAVFEKSRTHSIISLRTDLVTNSVVVLRLCSPCVTM
jgi:hypothetical protein